MTDRELGEWSVDVSMSSELFPVACGVQRVLRELALLRAQLLGHLERIAAQSELLSKRAAKAVGNSLPLDADTTDPVVVENWCKFDGSTGLSSTHAGRKSEGTGA